jgi:hypothetical protein
VKKRALTLNTFLIISVLTSLAGCQNNTAQSTSDTATSAKKAKAEKAISNSNCDSTVTNQEFSFDALALQVFKADTNKIKSLFMNPVALKMAKDTDKNNGGVRYYLYNFTDGINKITLFYNHGFYIEYADIKNDKVQLNKKVSIGMNQDVFLKLINVKSINCDTITVQDDEMTFESVYIFKKAKLREIRMGQTVE